MTSRKKTLLVGLDAACWEYADPLLATGQLPTLQQLMGRGTWGSLRSTMPALTPAAWSSIITGKNPGKHGVFDMTRRRAESYDSMPINARMRLGTPFWKRLNEQGLRVGLVNIPFTYPPDVINGFVVGGFGVPGSVPDLTHPREALRWIEEHFGHYEPTVPSSLLRSGRHTDIYAAEQKHQELQVKIALGLSKVYDVDVLVINLMLLDHINHKMPDMERVNAAVRQLDVDLKRLIDGFEPDHIMAISDHGSRRVKGDFLLHAWLRDQGYAVQVKRPLSEQENVLNWLLIQWLQKQQGWSGPHEKVVRRLARLLVPRLSNGLSNSFWQRVEKDIPFARENVMFSDELDYGRTRVYTGASYSGVLYYNVAGREPKGIVRPEQQAELTAELSHKLMQIKDPHTSAPLFSDVYDGEKIYTGTAKPISPNLVIDYYQSNWNILSTFRRGAYAEKSHGRYFVDNIKDFGHHSRDGIFVYAGSHFQQGKSGIHGHVMDIPATLLHLYNIPVPDDFDGRSMTETFTPDFLAQTPLRTQPGDPEAELTFSDLYSPEETEEIVSHLRALGYVD